jgi:glyoxylase-like metal-dependent hydrolase (beta-lactamase superfamily II)
MTHFTRRRFLHTAVAGATGAALLPFAAGDAQARGAAFSATDLGGGIHLIAGGAANLVAYGGPEGLLLLDGGPKAQSGALLKEALRATGAKRLHTLVNSHWHPDQTGLNEQAGRSGARIIAHENTKLWLKRRINTDWLPDKGYGPLPPAAIPAKSFYTREEIAFGDESLTCGHLGQAHTDGDLYVYFQKANVLFAGGVVAAQDAWPVLDWQTGGWIGGLVGAQDRLIKQCNESTKIVGSNGGIIDLKGLKAQREMFMTVFDRTVKALVKSLGPDEAYATGPAKEFEGAMGDSKAFVIASFKSLWGHYAPDA